MFIITAFLIKNEKKYILENYDSLKILS